MNTVDLYNVCLIIAMDTDRNMGKWTECLIHLLSSILECHNVAHLHFLFGLPLIFFFSVGVLNLFAVHTGILKRTGRVIIAIGLCFLKLI